MCTANPIGLSSLRQGSCRTTRHSVILPTTCGPSQPPRQLIRQPLRIHGCDQSKTWAFLPFCEVDLRTAALHVSQFSSTSNCISLRTVAEYVPVGLGPGLPVWEARPLFLITLQIFPGIRTTSNCSNCCRPAARTTVRRALVRCGSAARNCLPRRSTDDPERRHSKT